MTVVAGAPVVTGAVVPANGATVVPVLLTSPRQTTSVSNPKLTDKDEFKWLKAIWVKISRRK